MSVTALDLSVVTIESLVARDISAYSLRRQRDGAAQALTETVPTVLLPTVPVPGRSVSPLPLDGTATSVSVLASAHTHRAPSARRLVQVH